MTTHTADCVPEERGVFRGLAQSPLHFHNAIAELIDNSIVAEKTKEFRIHVDMSKKPRSPDSFVVTVFDESSGISLKQLKSHVFKLGSPPLKGSPHLSEHGWGLKNVLAKIETTHSDGWELLTRDSHCVKKNILYRVGGPLKYQMPIREESSANWPNYGSGGTGTILVLTTSLSFLKTVSRKKRGRPPAGVGSIMDYLQEHLGVFYRGYLENPKKLKGKITTSINWGKRDNVVKVEPDYRSKTTVKPFQASTGAGRIRIEGEIGLLDTHSMRTRKDRKYYYRNSPESQGVDFRIGDRVVMTRLLTEIWQRARHPSHNAFAGEFRIPGDKVKVPKTLNNKTKIDLDDPIWKEIVEAIRKEIPEPLKYKGTKSEADLREELAEQLKGHGLPGVVISENHPCYSGAGVPVDIYRDEKPAGGGLYIYETKAAKVRPLDVYQLMMYWDGLVEDGESPAIGYLVGKSVTTAAKTVTKKLNKRKDKKGDKYRFELRLWKEYGIKA